MALATLFLFFSFNDRTLLVLVEIREDSPLVLILIRVNRGGALPLPVATDGERNPVSSVHSLPPNSPLGSLGDR